MATKSIVFAASLGHLVLAYPPQCESHNDYDHYAHAPAAYHFEYDVKDTRTHDIKSRHEVGDGRGNVKGSYRLVEPGGSTSVVEYTADHGHGFNAKVSKIGGSHYYGEPSSDCHKHGPTHHY